MPSRLAGPTPSGSVLRDATSARLGMLTPESLGEVESLPAGTRLVGRLRWGLNPAHPMNTFDRCHESAEADGRSCGPVGRASRRPFNA